MHSPAIHPAGRLLTWAVIFLAMLSGCNAQNGTQNDIQNGTQNGTQSDIPLNSQSDTQPVATPAGSAVWVETPKPAEVMDAVASPTPVSQTVSAIPARTTTPASAEPPPGLAKSSDLGAKGLPENRGDESSMAMTKRRSSYHTGKSFSDLVKPHFFAAAPGGELVEIQGEADLVTEIDGRVKVRLSNDGYHTYLDLLALESELIGEHPVHKVYRLEEMGVPVTDALNAKLESGQMRDLFTNVEFEYQRRRFSSGVVVEVFPDGTFLVVPFELPGEWQSNDRRIASPTHLHLNARAFSGGSSPLAREYELEILSLPFEDQRYPPAPLARKQCEVYRESLTAADYQGLLASVGYSFTSAHSVRDLNDEEGFGNRVNALLWNGSGTGVQYYGFEGWWIADIFRSQGVSWLGECDTAGGLRRYPGDEEDSGRYYLTIRRSLEPDKRVRYRILEVDRKGEATELYTAPGIILMALPLPYDDRTWLMSAEGWPPAEGAEPPDPRWQAVYAVNLDTPGEYVKVRYPIDGFPKAPEAGLYGSSPRMSQDGNFLMNTLYGFTDEGGGIWVVDVSGDDFLEHESRFARIVSWDHTLSWQPLGRIDDDPTAMHLFMTGKEVADDFAMTANILRIRESGLESSIEESKRLLQMVGWNPVPFGWQKLSETQYRMLVETHYNYESSLMPRAKGVYIVPVDLAAE